MLRPLILILAVLFGATLYGQEAKHLSPAVKHILDRAAAGVEANIVAFSVKCRMIKQNARKELQELVKDLIDRGKMEDAIVSLEHYRLISDLQSYGGSKFSTGMVALDRLMNTAIKDIRAQVTALDKAHETPVAEAKSALEELAKQQVSEGKNEEAISTLALVPKVFGVVIGEPLGRTRGMEKRPLGSYSYTQSDGWKAMIVVAKDGIAMCDGVACTWERVQDSYNCVRITFASGEWIEVANGKDDGVLVVYETHNNKNGIMQPVTPSEQ